MESFVFVCLFKALHKDIDAFPGPKTFILISSVMTWAQTKRLDAVSVELIVLYYELIHTTSECIVFLLTYRMIQRFLLRKRTTGDANRTATLKITSLWRSLWLNWESLWVQLFYFVLFLQSFTCSSRSLSLSFELYSIVSYTSEPVAVLDLRGCIWTAVRNGRASLPFLFQGKSRRFHLSHVILSRRTRVAAVIGRFKFK